MPEVRAKASLSEEPPESQTLSAADGFTVVVLQHVGRISERASKVIAEFSGKKPQPAKQLPYVAARRLTEADAKLLQFELICCDTISVFIADGVVATASPEYLARLYTDLIRGEEFATVHIVVDGIPEDVRGARFCEQFFDTQPQSFPHRTTTTFKKARIMQHWAAEIGAAVIPDSS